jgi:glycosyl-4,4'-diaponeurosporenoate acyltransferase
LIGYFSGFWLLIIDILAWLVINLSVAGIISWMQADSFNPKTWLYREQPWEKGARFYERFFKIKKWKGWLPDGAEVSRKAFKKKHLQSADSTYLRIFILETCRAEILHWIIFVSGFVFFIWNPWYIGIIMMFYAAGSNLPCILTQRYNRIRLKGLLADRLALEARNPGQG